MNTPEEIREGLLDEDGSCRDINLQGPTWEGVRQVLEFLRGVYPASGRDSADMKVSLPLAEGDSRQLTFEDRTALLRHLQVFIYCEKDGSPFLELTFFPQDVHDLPDLPRAFLDFVKRLQALAGASRFFVRYENASWEFGDCTRGSGVFAWSE